MNAVEAKGLTKQFGSVQALSGLDLAVPAGTLYAQLGVNGAGKSTAIKILTGLCPQDTAVAPNLTAEENLILLAGLSGANRKEAKARTEALLESLQLPVHLAWVSGWAVAVPALAIAAYCRSLRHI